MTGAGAAITEQAVRESVATAQTHLERAAEQVVWQIEHEVWTVLGYPDWDTMREAEYGGAAVIVPRADRPELVAKLQAQGLSQRQTADTIGVSLGTVNNEAFKNEHGHAKPPRQTAGVGDAAGDAPPAADPTPAAAKNSGAGSAGKNQARTGPAPEPDDEGHDDPIGNAKDEAKNAPAGIGTGLVHRLEKVHGDLVDAGGPEAVIADTNDLPGSEYFHGLAEDTLGRLIPLLTEWHRQIRRKNSPLRGVQ